MNKVLMLFLTFIIFSALNRQSFALPTIGNIKIALEGLITGQSNHSVQDTVMVYLSKSSAPEVRIDSAKSTVNKSSLYGTFSFTKVNPPGHYYLIVKHRNSILTWSQPVLLTFGLGLEFNYDFTNSYSKAFGNNLVFKHSKYCIISGDINQDEIVDGSDLSHVENDGLISLSGYIKTDLNGDLIVDGTDISLVENSLANNRSSAVPFMKMPVRDNLPNKVDINRDVIILPYTPVTYNNGSFRMYYLTNNKVKLDTSTDGKTWKFKKYISTNAAGTTSKGDSLQSIIRRGNTWYSGWTNHSGSGSSYREWFNVATSTNGTNFTQFSGNPLPFNPGEDHSFFDNTDSFYCYIRPNIPSIDPRRKIGLMKSRDFFSWTAIDTILHFPDSAYNNPSSQLYLKQPYNMNVFKYGNDWWGFLHVLRLEDDGTENWNYPYTGLEETVETLLMHSANGTDWSYTNNKKAFLPLHDSVKQVYAFPTLVGDSLYIYSFESTLRHAGYTLEDQGQAAVDFAKGKYWKIFRYKISMLDMNPWKP